MPGSTYSTNLKIELMTTGENSGTWGDITNTNLGTALEQAVIGLGNPDYVSDANLTISITNSNAAQAARALVLNVTSTFGSLTTTRELVVPTIQKQYIVQNNTTGGQSITVKTSAGTGITVPNGRKAHLYVNGTNVIQMFDFVNILGGTIDNATLGATTASSARVTTLNASGAATLDGNVALGNAAGDVITVPGTIGSNLIFTDNTYDIGAAGATRPRNLFLSGAATVGGNLSVGGTLTLTGGVNLNGNVTVGDASTDTLTINSTITSNLIFTDNTYDIGASGATRPRNLFLAGNATVGGAQTLTGALTVDSTTDSSSTTTGSIQTDGGLGVAKALFVGTTANIAGAVTLSGGTANGVAYLDGSKVLTTGSALTFDGTNLGVGTSSPVNKLVVSNAGAAGFEVNPADASGVALASYNRSGAAYANLIYYASNQIFCTGGTTEGMRLTSTGLGIGTSSPSYRLQARSVGTSTAYAGNIVARLESNGAGYSSTLQLSNNVDASATLGLVGTNLAFGVGTTQMLTLDSSGNLGLGVTPSAWGGSNRSVMQFPGSNAIQGSGSLGLALFNNAYNNGTNDIYLANGAAYKHIIGTAFQWFTAPSGTAGNAITFTQAMTLDASGNLLLGATGTIDAAFRLQVTGAGGSISTATGTNSNGLRFDNTNTTSEWSFGTNSPGIQNAGDYFAWNRIPSGGSWSEYMRLDSSGNLGIGTTSPVNYTNYKTITLQGATTTSGGVFQSQTSDASFTANFYVDNGGVTFGSTTANSPLKFLTGNTERMRLDSSGNLGLGQIPAVRKFEINAIPASPSQLNGIRVQMNGTATSLSDFLLGTDSAGRPYTSIRTGNDGNGWMDFYTGSGPTEKMRLDSSGNLGLGVTPSAWLSSYKAFQVNTASLFSGGGGFEFLTSNAYVGTGDLFRYIASSLPATAYRFNSAAGDHRWLTAPSGTAGNAITFTQAMTLDASGNLVIGDTSGTARLEVKAVGVMGRFKTGAATDGRVEWAYNTTDIGYIGADTSTEFSVIARSGNVLKLGAGGSERARIDSSGNLLVGTTTNYNTRIVSVATNNALGIINTTASSAAEYIWNQATSGNNFFTDFATEGSFTSRGSITYNRAGGLVVYSTTSDYRAKDIIGPVVNPGATIDALKVYEGQMKGATQSRPMLVAHEAQAVTPYAVTGEKDAVNEDGTPKYQQMDVSSLVPLLIAEIQSLRIRIAQLEAK